MQNLRKIVANNLFTLRTYRGYSQEAVAFNLNMSQTGYGNLERGKSETTLTRIEQIARLYDIQPERLLTEIKLTVI